VLLGPCLEHKTPESNKSVRSLGDGLVFVLFDKWDLKPLAFKEAAGNLSGKVGSRAEERFLQLVIQHGLPAIRTDLTNSIRYGDICVSLDGFPKLIEVKTSQHTNSRVIRQLEALHRLHDYLVEDVIEELYGFPNIRRRTVHSPTIEYSAVFNSLIAQSRSCGSAICEVETGLRYAVFRYETATNNLYDVAKGMGKPFLFSLNESKNASHWPAYYPFCLSIRELEDVLEFLEGKFFGLVVVDLSVVERQALEAGFASTVTNDTKTIFRFNVQPTQDAQPMFGFMGYHLFGRVGFEFLSLAWLVQEILWEFKTPFPAAETDRCISPDVFNKWLTFCDSIIKKDT
jgi:hypothetical protein